MHTMFIFRNPDDVHELDILPLFFDSNKMLLLMKGPSVLDNILQIIRMNCIPYP
jgi:hypothetical protein